jgi:hypothetical protein
MRTDSPRVASLALPRHRRFGPAHRLPVVAVARVMYASSAWWGLTNAVDRQRAFFRRSIRSGYCLSDLPPFGVMCKAADQQLFEKVLSNPNHMLHSLLPPPTVASQNYNLRPRTHDRQLPPHTGRLTDSTCLTKFVPNYESL